MDSKNKSLLRVSLIPGCLRTADAARTTGFECIGQSIKFYTDLLLILVALGAFIYFLYAAFLYVTAFGDESKATQGKKAMTSALIGIGLALSAKVIVYLIDKIIV